MRLDIAPAKLFSSPGDKHANPCAQNSSSTGSNRRLPTRGGGFGSIKGGYAPRNRHRKADGTGRAHWLLGGNSSLKTRRRGQDREFSAGQDRRNWNSDPRSQRLPSRKILFAVATAFLSQGAEAQTPSQGDIPAPTTVSQAVFRSRWVAPQADLRSTGSSVARGQWNGAAPETTAEDLGISPFANFASPLRRGFSLGPVIIHPGLALGWEYTEQTNELNRPNSGSDRSSTFAAPTLALLYARAIGPWSVTAAYGGGFRYYFNPNYTSSGTNNERNPTTQTGSLQIAHQGARHRLNLAVGGSYGTGFDVITGGNVTQTNVNAQLDYEYILTSHSHVGANAALFTSSNTYAEEDYGNGNVSSFMGNTYLDWLWTGKTRMRFSLGAGESSQNLQGNSSVSRNYVQSLVSVNYQPKGKFTFDFGLGVGYVDDSRAQYAQYTGARAIYLLNVSYKLTDKTSLRGNISLQGTDIRPTFRIEANWRPRTNTSFSGAVYQDEGFSLATAEQVQVSRGVIGTVTQRLFSKVDLSLSAGWQQTENLSLSGGSGAASAQSGQTFSYGFASADLKWQIRDWVSFQTSLWKTTSNGNSNNNGGDIPETRAVVSLNLTL